MSEEHGSRDRMRWRRWASGRRPPWWPENEEWPPQRRYWGYRPHGGGFFARIVAVVLALLIVIDLGVAALASAIARALGLADVAPIAVAVIVFVVFFSGLSMAMRRAGLPVTRVLDALDRVAQGDYSVRVDPRGPREIRRVMGAFNDMVERLETADQRRRRLLADVTHELRTPLSVIQGQIEGAIDGVYPRDDAHLGAILDETRHMARIIEDLRTLSLAESGALALRKEAIDLTEVIDDVTDAYRPSAEANGVTLVSDVTDGPVLPHVDADPTRIRQVLENLVSNALRYTPSGGRIDVRAGVNGSGVVAVTVQDTGRGIAAKDLPSVFERFTRSADSHGSGLGLAIARDLVRAHGGEISAASDGEGRGTTVSFTLPFAS